MRYKEIIEGAPPRKFSANRPVGDTWEMKIISDCSDVLRVYKSTGQFLYRGLPAAAYPIFKGRSMPGRSPVDNSEEDQELFDEMLEANGCQALRGNSVFCTSDIDQSGEYGHPYAIFPLNGFKFTWTKFKDLQYMSEEIPNWPIRDPAKFKKIVAPRSDNLSAAIELGNEVYLNGSFYAVKFYPNAEAIENLVNQI